ncbi:MAG: DUF2971 domain-containing protein [Prolixibacteraceae bacterium]|nr:DUF2971 domain-containing protein [Prolixibacteraceae bacterium]
MKQEKTEIDRELESGKYLFKYCKFDVNALQIIINKTLFFSSPDKLNDPLDSQFDLKIKNPDNFSKETKEIIRESTSNLSEEIRELLRDDGSELGHITSQEKLFKEYFTYIQNTYSGICCFSQTHSDNLLWAHYADQARGLCFVFDREKLHESFQKNLKGSNYRIMHDKISYNGVKKLDLRLFKGGEFDYTSAHLFSKTSHWKYEKEYRFVLEKYKKTLFRLTIERFNPFFDFDADCLKYVITGQRMPYEHFLMLFRIIADTKLNVELCKHEFDQ